MITITNLEQLANLPVSASLADFLQQHLIREPFDTPEAAKEHWQQLNNTLIILDRDDDPHTLPDFPQHLINPVIEFPEYIMKAPDEHCLTLSITDQAGSGLYLLFPQDTVSPELKALTRWADEA